MLLLAAAGLLALLAWLTVTAPLSKSLQPVAEPSVTLLAADGTPIARRGALVEAAVRVDRLPDHVTGAFLAIEDRRFYRHPGIDPIGLARAAWTNLQAGAVREGGSTITQQLAKLAFLDSERTMGRKLQEMIIALWLELRLGKKEILSRYLSSVYFGDNVYGLRAAARHYFDSAPEDLSVAEAAMLAGLVKAPSRLAPTSNLKGARERSELVLDAMVRGRVVTREEAEKAAPARLAARSREIPSGTYFADWVFRQLETDADGPQGQRTVSTTLDRRLQALAVRTVAAAPLGGAQVALVAMRPDGRVVAMVGGRSYQASPFNRVTQARRQPGSTFKLFAYLAGLEAGLRPETPVRDAPVRIDGWTPQNADGRYRGVMTLREAFTVSSNVAAVRVAEKVGRDEVIATARRLGITSPLEPNPSLALGTSGVTLLELTGAFAGVAGNRLPVVPRGIAAPTGEELPEAEHPLDRDSVYPMLLDLLWSSANAGTGRAASLPVPTFGKTGTTQDNRDALFVGFVQGLVVGVWIGNDDNAPLGGVTGGGLPAEIWRDFVSAAIGIAPAPARRAAHDASPPPRIERREPRPQWQGDRKEGKDEKKRGKRDRGKKGKGGKKGKKGKD